MNGQANSLFDPHTACLTEQAMFDYIDGKLSARECHAVEKHLLDCAFCSEAMEGLELVKDRSKIHTAAVPSNESSGSGNTSGGRLVPFPVKMRLAVAAMIVLLLGSFILFRFILNDDSTPMQMAERSVSQPNASESPLTNTSDDQTFYRHFKPFPPSKEEPRIQEDEKKEEYRDSRQETATGSLRQEGESKAQENSSNADIVVSASNANAAPAPEAKPSAGSGQEINPKTSSPAAGLSVQPQAPPANNNMASGERAGYDADKNSVAVSESDDSGDRLAKKKEKRREEKKQDKAEKAAPSFSQSLAVQPSLRAGDTKNTESNKADGDVKPAPDVSPETEMHKAISSDQTVVLTDSIRSGSSSNGLSLTNTANTGYSYSKQKAPAKDMQAHKELAYKTASNAGPSQSLRVKSQNTVAEQVMQLGMKEYGAKNYSAAIAAFEKSITLQADNEMALFYLGLSYLSQNPADTQNAITRFDALLKKPGSVFIYDAKWYKALALIKASRKEDAKALLKELSETQGSYQAEAIQLLKELK